MVLRQYLPQWFLLLRHAHLWTHWNDLPRVSLRWLDRALVRLVIEFLPKGRREAQGIS